MQQSRGVSTNHVVIISSSEAYSILIHKITRATGLREGDITLTIGRTVLAEWKTRHNDNNYVIMSQDDIDRLMEDPSFEDRVKLMQPSKTNNMLILFDKEADGDALKTEVEEKISYFQDLIGEVNCDVILSLEDRIKNIHSGRILIKFRGSEIDRLCSSWLKVELHGLQYGDRLIIVHNDGERKKPLVSKMPEITSIPHDRHRSLTPRDEIQPRRYEQRQENTLQPIQPRRYGQGDTSLRHDDKLKNERDVLSSRLEKSRQELLPPRRYEQDVTSTRDNKLLPRYPLKQGKLLRRDNVLMDRDPLPRLDKMPNRDRELLPRHDKMSSKVDRHPLSMLDNRRDETMKPKKQLTIKQCLDMINKVKDGKPLPFNMKRISMKTIRENKNDEYTQDLVNEINRREQFFKKPITIKEHIEILRLEDEGPLTMKMHNLTLKVIKNNEDGEDARELISELDRRGIMTREQEKRRQLEKKARRLDNQEDLDNQPRTILKREQLDLVASPPLQSVRVPLPISAIKGFNPRTISFKKKVVEEVKEDIVEETPDAINEEVANDNYIEEATETPSSWADDE